LADSRSNENQACQLKEDSKGFAFASTQDLGFECDHGVDGQCDQQLQTFGTKVNKIKVNAEMLLKAAQSKYNKLAADCEQKLQERVRAQSALSDAEKAWSDQRSQCSELPPRRAEALCAYGSAIQSKCAAERGFKALVDDTNRANDPENVDSEVDRIQEYMSAAAAMCMMAKSHEKGLSGPLGSADMEACNEQAKAEYAAKVGSMNRYEGEFKRLSGSNTCAEGPVSFFNGQEWTVPATANPKASEYVRQEYKPFLHLKEGWPAFESCDNQGGENQGPATLHLIEDEANECDENWAAIFASTVDLNEKSQYSVGATLRSWGCDRLQEQPNVKQVKLVSTGKRYAVSYC